MVYCEKCGTEILDKALYCSECGAKLKSDDEGMSPETANEGETLQEMIHAAWNKGTVPPRKILCFTEENIYILEGTFLKGMGVGIGLVGLYLEKKDSSEKEEIAQTTDFSKLAAQDPDVVIIPYQEIMKLNMGKKRMLLNPTITIKTTSEDYKFTVMEGKKYKQYQKTLPALLGDKVTVE